MIFLPHYMWAENNKLNNFFVLKSGLLLLLLLLAAQLGACPSSTACECVCGGLSCHAEWTRAGGHIASETRGPSRQEEDSGPCQVSGALFCQ